MELLKLLSTSEIFVQIINFLLVFFLLKALIWKRFLGLIEERRKRIADEFKKAEDSQAQILKLKAEYERKMDQIEETGRARIREAVQESQRIAREIKEQAHGEAAQIIESAKEELQLEVMKAKEILKESVVDLTIQATQHLIREKLNPDIDKKIVDDFLTQIDRVS